jgi:ubiquinol-cytochrome c reductase iron-sulfur subunit
MDQPQPGPTRATKLKRLLIALGALAYGRRRRRAAAAQRRAQSSDGRIVPAGSPDRRAEYVVVVLLLLAALFAAGFIVSYAELHATKTLNMLLGVCMAGALACIAAALVVVAKRLIVTEEIEEDYPQEHPQEQQQVAQIVRESGSRFTRRKMLAAAAATAGGAVGLAGLTPALSLGPLWYTEPLDASPWHRGRRLVDADGHLMPASDIEEETSYSAFPEGVNPAQLAAPLVLIRMKPGELKLPAGRAAWAPEGILAYSRICTHAGCAIQLYRKPRFPVVEPKPALVCPCHYSTFDPATGATVIFGPAGRPLPQLPLMIDADGHLAAAGDYSGRVGPGWWAVRKAPS